MNIKAVARRAGVSTATVSRTINGSDKVSPKTAEKVRRAIEALHFYPNTNARALGSGRSDLYGLIISDITNPFFPELVKAFEDIALEHGKEVIIANTNYDPTRMESCISRMLQRKVDGLAIMTSEMDDRLIEAVSRRDIPMVFLDGIATGVGISSVRTDYRAGISCALEHLIGLGHERIAFISGPLRLASARSRYNAFIEVMEQHRFTGNPDMIQEGNHRVDGGHDAMRRMLEAGAGPTAVLASNDLTAIGAMGALHELDVRVPDDISVVGYDDIQLSGFTYPALTTLRFSRTDIATAAFRALFNSRPLGSDKVPKGEVYVIPSTLIVRKSTGPAAGQRAQWPLVASR